MSDIDVDAGWYWEAVVTCHPDLLDIFTYHLFEAAVQGTEEISQSESKVELKLYFSGGFSEPALIVNSVRQKMEISDDQIKLLKVEKKKVENWQANWKEHFKPLEIGKDFVVLPPWEKREGAKKHIVIQPGFGFGTGYHESTNLALQLLEWLAIDRPLGTILDVGTGSGILVIASLLLGIAGDVYAIDIDPEAIPEVHRNLELSGFKREQYHAQIAEPSALKVKPFDLVMANIEDHILVNLADDLIRLTKPQGNILLSGILTDRKQSLLAAFDGFKVLKELEMHEWTGLILQKA